MPFNVSTIPERAVLEKADFPDSIKRRSAFTHHLHEKHPNARLSTAQIDACNPKLRDGLGSSSARQSAIKVDRTGRRSSRAKGSQLQSQKSSSPVFFCRTGGENPTSLELTSTLAIPAIPELIRKPLSFSSELWLILSCRFVYEQHPSTLRLRQWLSLCRGLRPILFALLDIQPLHSAYP